MSPSRDLLYQVVDVRARQDADTRRATIIAKTQEPWYWVQLGARMTSVVRARKPGPDDEYEPKDIVEIALDSTAVGAGWMIITRSPVTRPRSGAIGREPDRQAILAPQGSAPTRPFAVTASYPLLTVDLAQAAPGLDVGLSAWTAGLTTLRTLNVHNETAFTGAWLVAGGGRQYLLTGRSTFDGRWLPISNLSAGGGVELPFKVSGNRPGYAGGLWYFWEEVPAGPFEPQRIVTVSADGSGYAVAYQSPLGRGPSDIVIADGYLYTRVISALDPLNVFEVRLSDLAVTDLGVATVDNESLIADPDGARVWGHNDAGGVLVEIDSATHTATRRIEYDASKKPIHDFAVIGSTIYVLHQQSHPDYPGTGVATITAYDTGPAPGLWVGHQVAEDILPSASMISGSASGLWAAAPSLGELYRLNPATLAVIATRTGFTATGILAR